MTPITQKQIEELRERAKFIVEYAPGAECEYGDFKPSVFLALLESIEGLSETLESIASLTALDAEHHVSASFWLKKTHEQCAEVLATDTQVARLALEKFGVEKGRGDA